MGIERFGTLFRRKQFRNVEVKKLPPLVKSLFIDCNGIFHAAKSSVFPVIKKHGESISAQDLEKIKKKYSRQGLEKKFLENIIERLDNILKEFHPRDVLVIAPDGTANAAKLSQQKGRRFGPKDEEYYSFDGNSLTPGTEIMFLIDKKIKRWLKKKKNEGKLPKKTVYSSHMDPGEGEHKIFQYIRDGIIPLDTLDSPSEMESQEEMESESEVEDEEGANVIYGADGDLFILSVLSPLDNIYLYRDNFGTLYSIEKFKDVIYDMLYFEGCDEKRLFQDFSLLAIFVGNDFVSKFPNLPGTGETLVDIMFRIYTPIKNHLTDDKNNIIWENFSVILKKLNSWKVRKTEDTYLYARDKLSYPVREMDDFITIKDVKGKVVEWKDGDYDSSKHTRTFDRRGFENVWYSKQFEPQDSTLKKKEKEWWTKKDVYNMSVDYLKILQWVQHYYTDGYRSVSNQFFYPYRITPLVHNISYYLSSIIDRDDEFKLKLPSPKSDGFTITPIHQLLSVLPPGSINLIPSQFRPIYKHLEVINPSEYRCPFPENTDSEHHMVPLIPPINLVLVNYLLVESELTIPSIYDEEDKIEM